MKNKNVEGSDVELDNWKDIINSGDFVNTQNLEILETIEERQERLIFSFKEYYKENMNSKIRKRTKTLIIDIIGLEKDVKVSYMNEFEVCFLLINQFIKNNIVDNTEISFFLELCKKEMNKDDSNTYLEIRDLMCLLLCKYNSALEHGILELKDL